MEQSWREVFGVVYLLVVHVALIPLIMLYSLGAVNDPTALTKFLVYGIVGIIGAFTYYAVREEYYENPVLQENEEFYGLRIFGVHSTEETALGKYFPSLVDWKRMLLVSFAVFSVFGMLVGVTGTFSASSPEFVQGSVQQSENLNSGSISQLVLAVEPAVASETIFFNGVFYMGFTAFMIFLFVRYFELPLSTSVVTSKLLSVFVSSIAFLLYHNARYGISETDQFAIFTLGMSLNTITAITNSLIPAWVLHANGNFYDKLQSMGLFNNEVAVAVGIVVAVIALGLAYLWIDPFGFDGDSSE